MIEVFCIVGDWFMISKIENENVIYEEIMKSWEFGQLMGGN